MLNFLKIIDEILDKYNTDDPFIIAEKLGFPVQRCELNNYNGKSVYSNNNTTLFVNNNLNIIDSLITCAQELGYALMYPKRSAIFIHNNSKNNKCKEEINCNNFAIALLIENKFNFEDNYSPLTTLTLIEGIKNGTIINQ